MAEASELEEALGQAVVALENIRDACSPGSYYFKQADAALERIGDGAAGAIEGRRAVAAQREAFRDALARCLVAFQLTREYLGPETLPAIEGWSWYDAVRHGEAVLAANGHLERTT